MILPYFDLPHHAYLHNLRRKKKTPTNINKETGVSVGVGVGAGVVRDLRVPRHLLQMNYRIKVKRREEKGERRKEKGEGNEINGCYTDDGD